MGYNKLDKINTLVALDLNDGNVSQTAREMGVDRGTIYAWQTQLENDVKLLAQVEAAKQNMANIEELLAMKAQAELSRRLDNEPENVKGADLIKLKDSGITNSRLLRGQSTQNIAVQHDYTARCLAYLEAISKHDPEASVEKRREYLLNSSALADVPREVRESIPIDK